MKKLGTILLSLSLLFGLFPQVVNAAALTNPTQVQDINTYLEKTSSIRGFDVSEEDVNFALAMYDKTVDDFQSIDEIDTFLGEVIKADYSNLDSIYSKYKLDNHSLIELLNDYGEELKDYIYLKDLDTALDFYTDSDSLIQEDSDEYPELDLSMYMDLLSQIGLTQAEIKNLESHFESLTDYLSSEEGQSKMEDIGTRMMTFAQGLMEKGLADETYKPSDQEIKEFASLYEELLSTLRLKVEFSIIKDSVETKYSIEEMMKMSEIKDADYKVAFYNDKSELLADVVITKEFIKANFGEIIQDVNSVATVAINKNVRKTVKGGELPKTSGNYISYTLIGMFLALTGFVLIRKIRTDESEIQ